MTQKTNFHDPSFYLRNIRSHPHFYSLLCKLALYHSRNIACAAQKEAYRRTLPLFAMNAAEARHCEELRQTGVTVLHNLFDTALIDVVYQKADPLFKALRLDFKQAYSVEANRRSSLEGLTYDELAATEKVIYVDGPLINIPECLPIAFNESILKIVTNFLGYIAPHFAVGIARDFPHREPKESSNFHKDFDDADCVPVYIYLVDTTDENQGGVLYVPTSNRYDARSCKPRLSRDLGVGAHDGRLSDEEVEKYYPKQSWKTIRVRRGSVAIFHGNGIHKGPCWDRYGDPRNQPRTAIRLAFCGYKWGQRRSRTGPAMTGEQYEHLTAVQKLFAGPNAR